MSAVIGVAEYFEPYLFGKVIQLIADSPGAIPVSSLLLIIIAWVSLIALLVSFSWINSLMLQDVAQDGSRRLWSRYVRGIFRSTVDCPVNQVHPARMLKAGIVGTNAASRVWQAFGQEIFQTVIGMLLIQILAFFLNPVLATFLLVISLGSFLMLNQSIKRTKPAEEEIESLEGKVAEHASELIQHKELFLTSRATERELQVFDSALFKLRGCYHSVASTWANVGATVRGVFSFSMLLMLLIGILMHDRDKTDIGEIVTFVGVTGYVMARVELLVHSLRQMASSIPALNELIEISGIDFDQTHDATVQQDATQSVITIENQYPELCLSLKNVSFFYDAESPVFRHTSFDVSSGSIVGISGPSGIGKTTLIYLILGLLKPTAGVIYFRGQEINRLDPDDLWSKISIVFQNSKLLTRSIKDNLRLGNPSASDDEVERITRMLGMHELIMQLKDGYQTLAGDVGRKFSGGQMQLLNICRALISNPELLLLDEPTSNLDSASERLVLSALESLRGQCTVLLISHRKTTLQIATQIFTLRADGLQDV